MERRKFSREFKLEAVKLIRERGCRLPGRPVILGCMRTCCAIGFGDLRQMLSMPSRGHGQMKPEQLEIDRLRKEVARLTAERDILKKAAAYFARDSI
jgi:transposase